MNNRTTATKALPFFAAVLATALLASPTAVGQEKSAEEIAIGAASGETLKVIMKDGVIYKNTLK